LANVVYRDTNDLCQNNYYYALSTPSNCNPTNFSTSHTGIADSGASGIYFASNAPVGNLNLMAPSVGVRVANGLPVRSVASTTLASAPSLPPTAIQGMLYPPSPIPSLAWALCRSWLPDFFFPSMLSWSSILIATASSADGANKMAPTSGASLSRPPKPTVVKFWQNQLLRGQRKRRPWWWFPPALRNSRPPKPTVVEFWRNWLL
jgi:hypothetical protein